VNEAALRELAARHGISSDFWDWQGHQRAVTPDTLIAVLGALGIPADTDEDVTRALLTADEQEWREVITPTVVMREGWTPWVFVHLPHGAQVAMNMRLEDGSIRSVSQIDNWVDPRLIDDQLVGRATFEMPNDLPLGWHQASVLIDGEPAGAATVIVTPHRLQPPDNLTEPVWGLMEQVYQVLSNRSWGIGDLDDLAQTASWAGSLGADFCLINPLHAASPVIPIEPSPYLPTSRRFTNPIYLSVEQVDGFDALPPGLRHQIDHWKRQAQEPTTDATIDRDHVWTAKLKALEVLFTNTQATTSRAFQEYCAREGQSLQDFALWSVLVEQYGEDPAGFPSHLQSRRGPEVAEFIGEHADRVAFHCWMQWQMHRQLERAHQSALDAGMKLGLIGDLAVGVHPTGADAWLLKDCLAKGVHVGAPPDQFNQLGQNWHQPPWHPRELANLGFAPYRELITAALSNCGAIRIDHIIGLFRLWWVPEGMTPAQGAYVYYDHEALIGILLLEAHRAGKMVIGEDLGVVEPSAREHLAERGILGTSVVWFEWRDGHPLPASDYRRLCLSTITTHDLPPTAGYLDLIHVRIREELGLLTQSAGEEQASEQAAIASLRHTLVNQGLCTESAGVEEMVSALHAWLGRTPSLLHGVALADLAGDHRPINQPGTSTEYPNWRLPLAGPDGQPLTLEALMHSPRVHQLLGPLLPKSAQD